MQTETATTTASRPAPRRPASSPVVGRRRARFRPSSSTGAPIRFARNTEVYGESEPAEYFYQVVTGAVRTYKVLQDGRRQIGAFYLPGDVFGLEAGEDHAFSAEAVGDSIVRVARRSAIVALAAREGDARRRSLELTPPAAFGWRKNICCCLAARMPRSGSSRSFSTWPGANRRSRWSSCRCRRQDIADYLGLTIETVSRTLTQLEDKEAIELPTSRRVLLRSPASLQQLNG